MSIQVERKTSPKIKETVKTILELSRENQSPLWRDIAKRLSETRQNYADLNVGKISKLCKDGDIVVVPGKVLGSFFAVGKVKISALDISEKAMRKVKESGSEFIPLQDLAKENPEPKNIKIMR
ncbi:MAG: 50S ribosomal protein L18e [Candidatus Thermoplasmatota archaeon]|nr:50S ribosomal protein L18e [Candidatus Thermoplasmatota archaeon]